MYDTYVTIVIYRIPTDQLPTDLSINHRKIKSPEVALVSPFHGGRRGDTRAR